MSQTCIARQPIVDTERRVHGYEILFRDCVDAEVCDRVDGDSATAAVILRALMGLGLERITTGRLAFINCTQRLLNFEGLELVLPPELVVLEVLEDIEPHPQIIRRLEILAEKGYRIALDDFVHRPGSDALVEVADYVKVDVRATSPSDLRQHAARPKNGRRTLIAEKVETYDEFRRCADLGFEYFQGWFFCKPETLESPIQMTNRVTAIQVIARLHEKDVEIDDVVRLVTLDPALSYCVLRVANSSAYARRVQIDSVHDGVMRLGIDGLRRWVSIMLMSRLDNKPSELLVTAVIRARMCELLGSELGGEPDGLFTIGLFSILEALFDRPLGHILAEVPLGNKVTDALVFGTGTGGEVLRAVLAHECGAWKTGIASQFDHATLGNAWVTALDWTQAVLSDMGLAPRIAVPAAPTP